MRTEPADYRALRYYDVLDAYRFLAAALVAVGHFDDGFRLGLERFSPLAVRFGLFVDFFFILSGFVIALNYQGRIGCLRAYGDFLWRRLARIWPLHLAVLAGVCGLALLGTAIGHRFTAPEKFDLAALPWNIVLLQAWGPVWRETFNVAAWSISAELFVYLLFPVFAWQARRLGLWLNLALIVAFVAAFAQLRQSFEMLPWYQATFDLGNLRAVPSFLLGVLIERVLSRQRRDVAIIGWPAAHGLFVAAVAAIHFNAPAELVIALFGAFVLAAALASQGRDEARASSPSWAVLGQASYGLYMVHMLVMTCGIVVFRRVAGPEALWGPLMATGAFIISVMLAIVLYRRFEDPLRRRLNAVSPFRQGQAVAPRPAHVLTSSD